MRIATFNLESLDAPVAPRARLLRPALERLEADILCLQEVNGQKAGGRRTLAALDELLAGTPYAAFHRAVTRAASGAPADRHNLVSLSRWPIARSRQIQHDLLAPPTVPRATAVPPDPSPAEIRFERPLLVTEIATASGPLTVVNVHLRAPLASTIPGGKLAPFAWRSVAAWAEGFFHSGLKRTGQALELRLLVDALFDAEPDPLVLVAGDFNAEDHETPVRLVAGAPEDTGNPDLAARALVVLDRAIDRSRRFSVMHHGRPQMLDHMLASHRLLGLFRGIEIQNEALGDEAVAWGKGIGAAGSYHAAIVASFADHGAAASD
jgi:endonuclease/exonuclease/phosphatase family metal-dependent hydrolase